MINMKNKIDGKALVYADGAFNTPTGKTAHGLVRFTNRYEVVGVLDHKYAGQDSVWFSMANRKTSPSLEI